MKPLRMLIGGAFALMALTAQAQWLWVDKDGRKVFSDQPPPVGTPQAKILKQPGGRPTGATSAASEAVAPPAAAASAPAGNSLRISGKDKQLEENKKKADAVLADKKAQEQAQQAKLKAENCERAKLGKINLDSGARIARANAQGEREFLDDNTRANEARQFQEAINSNCQ